MPPKKKLKVHTPFQDGHAIMYGVEPTTRDTATSSVVSARCRFCVAFSREVKEGRKRNVTSNHKYFTSPFRTDNYTSHLRIAHPKKWEDYQALSIQEKKSFFDLKIPLRNTMLAHVKSHEPLCFLINKVIIEEILGGILFQDNEDVAKERGLRIFKLLGEDDSGTNGCDSYTTTVSNVQQFRLAIEFVAKGSSFRCTSHLVQSVKDILHVPSIGCISEQKVASYVRIVVAVNLQRFGEILRSVWAFSIALDTSTIEGTGYLDVRIRFAIGSKLHNFHLLAIPMFFRHTGENMFNMLRRFFDSLYPDWFHSVIGVSTDGDRAMTGRFCGVATHIEGIALPGFFRIWCGLHQLDLVMRHVFTALLGESFCRSLTALISYLRRQVNLIEEMGSQCPKVANTRWLSMGRVLRWLNDNRVRVEQYLLEKTPECNPSPSWWIVVFALCRVLEDINKTVTKLQGLTTLISQQSVELRKTVEAVRHLADVKGPLSLEEVSAAEEESGTFVSGNYSVALNDVKGFLDDLGTFPCRYMEKLEPAALDDVLRSLASMFVSIVSEISMIVVERDCANAAAPSLPPVFPSQLVHLRRRDFSQIVRKQMERLKGSFSLREIDQIEIEHKELINAYADGPAFKRLLDGCSDNITFEKAWDIVGGRFPMLCKFAGGLASVFPGTANVESDFSIMNWEKDEFRGSLTDFSLEGILQAKQFTLLQAVTIK